MRIQYYFMAWTTPTSKPVVLWVEAKNQISARNLIIKQNPYVRKLIFTHSKRIE